MRGQNEAEAVIVFRAESDAAQELAEIREETEGIEKGFAGLNRGMIASSLGFLGLSFGAKELAENFQEVTQSNASVQFSLDLLGPAAEKAHDEMSGEFRGIANDVAATEREVSEAFAIIIANSGGIAPSVEDLATAFGLARLKGIDFEDAAARIGKALQGNLEPLEELLDPSGRRSIASYAEVVDRVAENASDAITPIDELSASFREFGDSLVGVADEENVAFFEKLLRSVSPLAVPIKALADSMGLVNDEIDKFEGNEILGPLGIEQIPVDLGAVTIGGIGGGIIGTSPGSGTPLVFNINAFQIGSQAQFIDQITREIERRIRNNNRQGTNVSDQ